MYINIISIFIYILLKCCHHMVSKRRARINGVVPIGDIEQGNSEDGEERAGTSPFFGLVSVRVAWMVDGLEGIAVMDV